ncbi:MAG: hypothetical protein K0S54_437 [Alphaproteobacteria bacterium]|jgi:hypothetical protein|nr:hypothetical protein [Alphaproteobacteria bacterium]
MRLLKTLVIAMGVLLVVGFGALIYVIAGRLTAPPPTPVATAPAVPAPQAEKLPEPVPLPKIGEALPPHFTPNFGEQTLMLPPGARISDFSAGGGRLVLRAILADQSQQLIVVDLNTGALIGTLNIENSGEPAPTSMLPGLPSVNVPPRNAQEGKK